jgi:hypothetical protein
MGAQGSDRRARRHADHQPDTRTPGAKLGDDFFVAWHCYGSGRHYAAILWWSASPDAPGDFAMTAQHAFSFGGYLLRPAEQGDLHLATEWTAADVYHAGKTKPEFWIEQTINRDSYVLEDTEGPIFFFKIHRLSIKAIELHCQFPPTDQADESEGAKYDRKRVQQGILKGFEWLEGALKKTKVEDLFFDSAHGPLRAFAVKRLGFSIHSKDKLSKIIGER